MAKIVRNSYGPLVAIVGLLGIFRTSRALLRSEAVAGVSYALVRFDFRSTFLPARHA